MCIYFGLPILIEPFFFQEADELFNFIPPNSNQQNTNRKRARLENAVYSFLKKAVKGGTKVIRIEVYDADKLKFDEVEQLCNCNAEICIQHVVKNTYNDDVYIAVKEVIAKIEGRLETYY